MPNWVFNSVSITGDQEKLDAFVAKATNPHPESFDEATGKVVYTNKPEFSFWNFVAPPKEAVESGEYFGTHGFSGGKAQGDTPNNWYNFQSEKWGTKWDACNAVVDNTVGSVTISYDTAWSIPDPVMTAMVEQHPDLSFEFHCEEEQGWGAKYEGSDGNLIETENWDVPESHADYAARDNQDNCLCANYSDEEDWFSDCPRDDSEFFVVVSTTYKVLAQNAEHAWEAWQTAGLELTDETVVVVKDEDGQRIYPTLENGVE